MWIWRKMNLTSWVEKKSNDRALRDVGEKRDAGTYFGGN